MARVTVEDCIDKVDSPYELVLVAKERATQLNSGIEPTLERDNDCLLYTSPSPRDATLSRMPSSA